MKPPRLIFWGDEPPYVPVGKRLRLALVRCPGCERLFVTTGRRWYCTHNCYQTAYRRRHAPRKG